MKKRILFVMVSVFALAPAVMGAPLLGEGTKNATLGKQDCEARMKLLDLRAANESLKKKIDAQTVR